MSTPAPSHPDELTQDARQLLIAINQLSRNHAREQRRGVSTASRMIDILDQKGLLRRSPDRQDASSLKLEATEKGRENFEQIEAKSIERMKLLLGNADPDCRMACWKREQGREYRVGIRKLVARYKYVSHNGS
jgi:DNA-binding MarR family transcriptional regulator